MKKSAKKNAKKEVPTPLCRKCGKRKIGPGDGGICEHCESIKMDVEMEGMEG